MLWQTYMAEVAPTGGLHGAISQHSSQEAQAQGTLPPQDRCNRPSYPIPATPCRGFDGSENPAAKTAVEPCRRPRARLGRSRPETAGNPGSSPRQETGGTPMKNSQQLALRAPQRPWFFPGRGRSGLRGQEIVHRSCVRRFQVPGFGKSSALEKSKEKGYMLPPAGQTTTNNRQKGGSDVPNCILYHGKIKRQEV
jgi:hypothetical protein